MSRKKIYALLVACTDCGGTGKLTCQNCGGSGHYTGKWVPEN